MLINIFTVALFLLLLSVSLRGLRALPVLLSKRTDINKSNALIPFHKMYLKHKYWIIVYYIFHILLIFIPLTATGHLLLIEESFLHWSWFSTPDSIMDVLTLLVIAACMIFFIKNILTIKKSREWTERQLFLILLILPFLTGYLLSNTSILSDSMFDIHVITSILLIIGLLFSSIKINIDANQCVGCISCSMSCPAKALDVHDKNLIRIIQYQLSRCLYCGNCLITCPYNAIKAYHGFSISKHLPKRHTNIAQLDLYQCVDCRKVFSTDQQLMMVGRYLDLNNDCLEICPECRAKRMMYIANSTVQMSS